MGNPRVTLPEELHDLVRDVVADLRSAARGFGRDAAPSDHATPVAERRVVRQATILRLPEAEDPAPSTPPSTTQLEEAALRPRPEPELAPQEPFPWPGEQRQRAFLARLEVASAVPRGRQPARTRRVPVACRRASPLDAARTSRMLRVAIPAVPLAPATLTAAPSWVREVAATLAAPAHAAPQSLVATPVVRPAVAVPKLEPVPSPSTDPAAAPPAAAEESRPLWRDAGGHLANLGIAAALSFVVMFCALVVGLVVTGHHLEQVVTGSMQPNIPIQSLVVTERIQVSQLRVGDILVFPNPNNTKETIVHRIIWLSHDQSGDVLVRTKGDYNAAPDAWTVKRQASADADRVIWVIPGGGTIAGLLQEAGLWGLVLLVIAVIGFYGVRKVRSILSEDEDEEADVAAEPLS